MANNIPLCFFILDDIYRRNINKFENIYWNYAVPYVEN